MVGLGSSNKTVVLALSLAVLAHVTLLAITFETQWRLPAIDQQITVTISPEPELSRRPQQTLEKAQEPDSEIKALPQNKSNKVIAKRPDKAPSSTPQVKLITSIKSADFQDLIIQDTAEHSSANANAIAEFSETFTETLEKVDTVPLMTNDGLAQVRGNGVFMTQNKNGRRTCGAFVMQLLSADGFGQDTQGSITSKDCTPEKTFELKLNQPNNGWMER